MELMQTPDESFESYYNNSLDKLDKITISYFYYLLGFHIIWYCLLLYSLSFIDSSSKRISEIISHNITVFFTSLNYYLGIRTVVFDAMKRIKTDYYYPVIIYTTITPILALISWIFNFPGIEKILISIAFILSFICIYCIGINRFFKKFKEKRINFFFLRFQFQNSSN
ncbi:MAG: hypothetical protein ACFFAH_14645 [Promethearchaeota archaeon]